jgi:hypothetical protein
MTKGKKPSNGGEFTERHEIKNPTKPMPPKNPVKEINIDAIIKKVAPKK